MNKESCYLKLIIEYLETVDRFALAMTDNKAKSRTLLYKPNGIFTAHYYSTSKPKTGFQLIAITFKLENGSFKLVSHTYYRGV